MFYLIYIKFYRLIANFKIKFYYDISKISIQLNNDYAKN